MNRIKEENGQKRKEIDKKWIEKRKKKKLIKVVKLNRKEKKMDRKKERKWIEMNKYLIKCYIFVL